MRRPPIRAAPARPLPATGPAPRRDGRGPEPGPALKLLDLAALVVFGLAAHMGLGGAVAASRPWAGGLVGVVLVALLVKAAVLGGLAVHRGRTAGRR